MSLGTMMLKDVSLELPGTSRSLFASIVGNCVIV